MLKTKQRSRKQIKDLQTDLEVINPIESKTILGGDWYDDDIWDMGWMDEVVVYGNSSGGGWYDPFGGWGDPWGDNQGGDNYGGGSPDGGQTVDDYGDDLTQAEKNWIYAHIIYLPSMINNKIIAEQYGQGQRNGVYDALRHALWSALDAHDMGAQNAYDFHTLHETEHWHPIESPSDLINNGWGYNWAMSNGDPEDNINQFIADFNHAVQNGNISIIP